MIKMAAVVTQLNYLHLECLEEDWVTTLHHSEFLDFDDFPPEYENVIESLDLGVIFKNILLSIDLWLSQETETNEEKTWAMLSHIIQYKKLLAILAYYMDYGSKNVLTKEYRDIAILASRIYFKLLSIPGYKAYHIYHSQLFTNSLACLGYPKAMCDADNFDTKNLTRQVNLVIKELRNFVLDLRVIIEDLQLNPDDMNFEIVLSHLVDITGGAIVNKLLIDKIELAYITRVIYEIIDILICDANNEPNEYALNLLFKSLLPKFIAASLECRTNVNLVRASYVTYSGLLLSKYGKAALSGFMVLLEHLCCGSEGLERAEVRTARVSLVVGLMSLLPAKSYKKFVRWLLQLSTTGKLSHRQISMEILASLLKNDNDPEEERPNESTVTSINKSTVEIPNELTDSTIQTGAATMDNPNEIRDRFFSAIDDESSQDSQVSAHVEPDHEASEEEIAGLLRQRPHTVPHADILRAVFERVYDVSCTLRTRAINILTECLNSPRPSINNAIKELQGDGNVSRLMLVAATGVCDERAAVRKASVGLIQRLFSDRNSNPLQSNDLTILVRLCRDASVLVRSHAISALGELVTVCANSIVFEAFLTGPMHQLSDPETKVQEIIVSFLQQLVFERLRTFVPGCDDPLPWMFLSGITRHNMRKHLNKVCVMLTTRGNCINHRTVDILSTHLGALDDDRDLQCLALLTCMARHVDYSDVGFVIEYFYKLSENEEGRDTRLMLLTIELITLWSRFIEPSQRSALRDHLVRRLADAKDDGCRIKCVMLAGHLNPENIMWASELMQLSERRAVENNDVEEGLRAVDLSLVANAPPSTELVQLFVNAIKDPPSSKRECDQVERSACVVAAGRLCIRSREMAIKFAPLLAALLSRDADPLPARSNALIALTDICIRYTNIVEPLLGTVCNCLSQVSPTILRRTAASELTRLLLGGYLRLRTPLYYRYCALLADDEPGVREPAEYYVTSCLTTDAIYHHFVDCVLYYNREETETINFDARQLIYDVMLQRMSLVQKLNIQCRLAREVLQHAADLTDEGDEELPPSMNAALLDTITLLCGPRMKLPKKPQSTGDANDIDDLQERVTTNIVSHKMKRTVAEVLVPAVLRLYSRLRLRGGQLVAYLVRIATDLLTDYRQEIEEMIENDEELVERVQMFQETIGSERTFGNVRNLVTSNAPPEPDTPRAPRRRARITTNGCSPKKRSLRI